MFTELDKILKSVYTSDDDNIARDFIVPIMTKAVSFDRTSGYFSSKALASISEGLEHFAEHGQTYRLIVSKEIAEEDFEQMKRGYALKRAISDEMISSLNEELNENEEKNISNLAYLIANNIVDIRIAFRTPGIFHDKCGIAKDRAGNIITYRGSNNFTNAALYVNYESFNVTCSWKDTGDGFYMKGIQTTIEEFEKLWNNESSNTVVLPVDDVVKQKILTFNKSKVIQDEVILKPNCVILDYDNVRNRIFLTLNDVNPEWFSTRGFYRVKLNHMVDKIVGNVIYFKDHLNYVRYKKVDAILSTKVPELGYSYATTSRYKKFIEARDLHIRERQKLGIELKTDATRLTPQFKEFEQVVSNAVSRPMKAMQMKDAFYMTSMLRSSNFSVPGAGKTSTALAVYAYLKHIGKVKRIVVVCPINAFKSWISEFEKTFGNKEKLNYFSIQDKAFKTPAQKYRALKYESDDCNLFLFNYNQVGSFIPEIQQLVSEDTLLIFDEVHKVKLYQGTIAESALAISKKANYTIAMTGTPIPNSYLDIYNLLHILYNDEYDDFFGFNVNKLSNPTEADIEEINSKLQPFFCRTTKKDLMVPPPNPDAFDDVKASPAEHELFNILRDKYQENRLALFIRLLQMESNPKLLLKKLDAQEFANFLEYDESIELAKMSEHLSDYSEATKKLINSIDITTKKKACLNRIEKLVKEGKPVVVWCVLRDSISSITELLKKRGINAKYVMGEVEPAEREELVQSFCQKEFQVLVTNPHTLAESVSLHSVCHDAVYFEYSYNLVHLLQSKDRIHRLGLEPGQYTQYYYLCANYDFNGLDFSMNKNVYDRLKFKEERMLNAIDNYKLTPICTPQEDIELIFKNLFSNQPDKS